MLCEHPKAILEGTPRAQSLLWGPQGVPKKPPKQGGHHKATMGGKPRCKGHRKATLRTTPRVHALLGDNPEGVPNAQEPVAGTPRGRRVPSRACSSPDPPGGTHMSLAGRFLPSTMRMESALRRAMAGGQRSATEPSAASNPQLPQPRAHVRAGATGSQSECWAG